MMPASESRYDSMPDVCPHFTSGRACRAPPQSPGGPLPARASSCATRPRTFPAQEKLPARNLPDCGRSARWNWSDWGAPRPTRACRLGCSAQPVPSYIGSMSVGLIPVSPVADVTASYPQCPVPHLPVAGDSFFRLPAVWQPSRRNSHGRVQQAASSVSGPAGIGEAWRDRSGASNPGQRIERGMETAKVAVSSCR